MNLTQRQLRLFTTTAALGNISRAGEALHISQPALTRALQEFEAQLGVTLFNRTTRKLSLTSEGEHFLPVAQRLLADMGHALQSLQAQARGPHGTVSLAVGTAVGTSVLPAILRDFSQSHPGVRVRLIDDNSAGITQRVARAEADLGIGSPIGDTGALQCIKLLEAPIGLLGDPKAFKLGRAATARDFARLPLLKEPADTSIAHLLRAHGSDVVAQMDHGTEVSSLALQLALASAGVGVAVLSALGASHPQAANLRFMTLQPLVMREIFLITRRDQRPSPSVRALATAITQALAGPVAGLHRLVRTGPFSPRP